MRLPRLGLVSLVFALTPLLGAARQDAAAITVAAEALRGDPVYVDAAAERALTGDEAEELRGEIRSSGTAVFVAVLPEGTGDPEQVAEQLVEETELSGTYAVVVGNRFRATGTELANADELATAAFQAASPDGTAAVLSRFVDSVTAAAAASGGGSAGGQAPSSEGGAASDSDDDSGSILPFVLIGVLAVGGVGFLVWLQRRRRQREAERRRQFAADREMIRAELAVLADDVLRLEPEVDLHPEAREDYEAGLERHRIASAALDYADERIDLVRVDRVVAEARYAMARAKALVAGREPPAPPEDLSRPGRHAEPPVELNDQGAPVYGGGQPFYGGGWFGGGGGMFEGLLLGSMLGGWGWGGPIVVDHHDHGDGGHDGDGDSGGDWGGDGGGDFGGGDFGGGDFGGGDFGGGDFGGGDF